MFFLTPKNILFKIIWLIFQIWAIELYVLYKSNIGVSVPLSVWEGNNCWLADNYNQEVRPLRPHLQSGVNTTPPLHQYSHSTRQGQLHIVSHQIKTVSRVLTHGPSTIVIIKNLAKTYIICCIIISYPL